MFGFFIIYAWVQSINVSSRQSQQTCS